VCARVRASERASNERASETDEAAVGREGGEAARGGEGEQEKEREKERRRTDKDERRPVEVVVTRGGTVMRTGTRMNHLKGDSVDHK